MPPPPALGTSSSIGTTCAAMRAALRTCDYVMLGGGGLIQDATSWRSSLYYLGIPLLAQHPQEGDHCPTHKVSAPSERHGFVAWSRTVFGRMVLIDVRDDASRDLLLALRDPSARQFLCRPTPGFPTWSPEREACSRSPSGSPALLPASIDGSAGLPRRQRRFWTAWHPSHLPGWTSSCSFHRQTWHSRGQSRSRLLTPSNSSSRLSHLHCWTSAARPR